MRTRYYLFIALLSVGLCAPNVFPESDESTPPDADKQSAIQLISDLYPPAKNIIQSIGEGGSLGRQEFENTTLHIQKRASEGDAEAEQQAQLLANISHYVGQGFDADMIGPNLWKVEFWESTAGGNSIVDGSPIPPNTSHYYWRVDTKNKRIKPLTLNSWATSGGGDPMTYIGEHPRANLDEEIDWLPWFQVVQPENGAETLQRIPRHKEVAGVAEKQ